MSNKWIAIERQMVAVKTHKPLKHKTKTVHKYSNTYYSSGTGTYLITRFKRFSSPIKWIWERVETVPMLPKQIEPNNHFKQLCGWLKTNDSHKWTVIKVINNHFEIDSHMITIIHSATDTPLTLIPVHDYHFSTPPRMILVGWASLGQGHQWERDPDQPVAEKAM